MQRMRKKNDDHTQFQTQTQYTLESSPISDGSQEENCFNANLMQSVICIAIWAQNLFALMKNWIQIYRKSKIIQI